MGAGYCWLPGRKEREREKFRKNDNVDNDSTAKARGINEKTNELSNDQPAEKSSCRPTVTPASQPASEAVCWGGMGGWRNIIL